LSIALASGISASAGTIITYSDTVNDNSFATASYSLTAANNKKITSSVFSDSGLANTSDPETADKPNMFEPNSGFLLAPPTDTLVSAEYDLSYTLTLASNRNVTDNGDGPFRAQTNPNFGVENDGFTVTLVFKDGSNTTLGKVDVTSLSGPLDLMPYLMDGGAIESAFDAGDLFIKTRFRAGDVVFTADLSGYDPTDNPDRNVTIDYNLKEKLNGDSSVTLDFVPEPATFSLLGLGLAGLLALGRKFKA
jgi:hypothetical protein